MLRKFLIEIISPKKKRSVLGLSNNLVEDLVGILGMKLFLFILTSYSITYSAAFYRNVMLNVFTCAIFIFLYFFLAVLSDSTFFQVQLCSECLWTIFSSCLLLELCLALSEYLHFLKFHLTSASVLQRFGLRKKDIIQQLTYLTPCSTLSYFQCCKGNKS